MMYLAMEANMKVYSLIAVIFLLIIIGPFATIWSLNTLFPVLSIPYTFETWLAVVFVSGLVKIKN